MNCYLNYGSRRIDFELPSSWTLITQGSPSWYPENENVKNEINRALDNPVGSLRIEDIAKPKMAVVILFDDLSRPTPAYLAFPELLRRLNLAGVKDKDITALCALGTHSPLSNEELKQKIGDEAFSRLSPRVLNHNSFATNNVIIGKTSYGSLIEVNPLVLNADLVIGIGSCIPHPLSGFGGGSKIIMPGISSIQAVKDHHIKWRRNPKLDMGAFDGNPFHQEQDEYAKMMGLILKIDFVLNEKTQVVKVYFGEVISEHKKAVEECKKVYSVKIPKLSDVTIASAYPLDQRLPQTFKGLDTATRVTRAGGHIILAAANEKSDKFLDMIDALASVKSANDYHKDLMAGHYNPPCPPYGIDFHIGCLSVKISQEKFSGIIYVTDKISKVLVEKMGFTHTTSIEQALALVKNEVSNAEALVLPAAGTALPDFE